MKVSGVPPGNLGSNLASTSFCLCNFGKNHLSLLVQAAPEAIGDPSITDFIAP